MTTSMGKNGKILSTALEVFVKVLDQGLDISGQGVGLGGSIWQVTLP